MQKKMGGKIRKKLVKRDPNQLSGVFFLPRKDD